jgi:hypothetical protein
VRFGAFQENSGDAASSEESFLKKLDLSRPLTQSLRVTICESCICGSIARSVCRDVRSFGNAVSLAHTSPPSAAKRQARRSRAMRPRWLAWAAFILDFSGHGFL